MTKLVEIFWQLEKPSTKWSGYFDVYERHVGKFVGKSPRILEIGVYQGGSLELWHRYFGEGTKVVAVDINKECLEYKYDYDVEILLGDQADRNFWKEFFPKYGQFDIIIDDGGHTMNQQIVTVEECFNHLKDNGVLVVEDTHTSYWSSHGGNFGARNTFLEYAKRSTDVMNQQFFGDLMVKDFTSRLEDLYNVSFYNSQVVFEKKHLEEFKILDNGTDAKNTNAYDWAKNVEKKN